MAINIYIQKPWRICINNQVLYLKEMKTQYPNKFQANRKKDIINNQSGDKKNIVLEMKTDT